jgi:7-cyano-7-deazaguanine synthase
MTNILVRSDQNVGHRFSTPKQKALFLDSRIPVGLLKAFLSGTSAQPERQMNVVVLCSGGMDSVTALYWAQKRKTVAAVVTFDYGAKHNHREIPFAAEHARRLGCPHHVIALDFISRLFSSALLRSGGEIPEGHYEASTMVQTVVPFRNAIMLSIATGVAESCGAQGVVIAAHSGDHAIYPDCREEFMGAMAGAMRLGTYAGVELLRPFIAMNKAQIVTEGAALGVDFGRTWSCYKGGEIHCGKCGTCVERREAFLVAGLPDPTKYASIDPLPAKPARQNAKSQNPNSKES